MAGKDGHIRPLQVLEEPAAGVTDAGLQCDSLLPQYCMVATSKGKRVRLINLSNLYAIGREP